MRIKRKFLTGLAVIASLSIVAAACSSDDDPSSSPVAEAETSAPAESETITDIVAGNEDFSTLLAAVEAADLGDTLAGEGPFTVFAPTDDAFAALPEGLVDCLLLEENIDPLTAILTYHVVDGAVMSTDLTDGPVPTLQGEEITVDLTDGVTLNDSVSVAAADVEASNGVIHVIDGVLVPPSLDVPAFLETCPA